MKNVLKRNDFFTHDGLPLIIQESIVNSKISKHSHQFSELAIVINGTGIHSVGKQKWHITYGDIFVITGEQQHSYSDSKQLKIINIIYDNKITLSFPGNDLKSIPGYYALFTLEPIYRTRHEFKSRMHLSGNDLSHTIDLVGIIQRELTEKSPGYKAVAISYFIALQVFLARCYNKTPTESSRELYRIGEVLSYLQNNYQHKISLDHLANIACMSKRNLLRIFAECMKTTPINYLLDIRLRHAEELLQNSNLNITEIAYKTGFNDSNYFSRQFRNAKGISPRDFRKSLQKTLNYES